MSECKYCTKHFEPRSTGGHKQRFCSAHCRIASHSGPAGRYLNETMPPNVKGGRVAICAQPSWPSWDYRTEDQLLRWNGEG